MRTKRIALILLGAGLMPALFACYKAKSFEPRVVAVSEVKSKLTPNGKPLVINHWATWCPPCVDELPRLAKIAKKFEGKADFVGVSWDLMSIPANRTRDQVLQRVQTVPQEAGIPYFSYVADGSAEELGKVLSLDSLVIPQTFVFDKDGKLIRIFEALENDADVAEFEKVVTAQLR